MSYVQGTTVLLEGRFEQPDPTDARKRIPFDPPNVRLTVEAPSGSQQTHTFPDGNVVKKAAGHYTYQLDTTPAAGTWEYEWDSGTTGAVAVARKSVTVTSRLRVAP